MNSAAPPPGFPDMNRIVGAMDIAMLVFDSLRYDTAVRALAAGATPNLAQLLPPAGWEERETPGNFTLPAHLAFFSGFLPTPVHDHRASRPLALRFEGAHTTSAHTCVFDGVPDVVAGLASRGHRTICIGGVQFFNQLNPLGKILPGLFEEAHWQPAFGATSPDSTARQVALACDRLAARPPRLPVFLYINISATHAPHGHYLPGTPDDSVESQMAALAYADSCLPPLLAALRARGSCFMWLLGDHGDAYGEDGRVGHRHSHPVVMRVPYAHVVFNPFASVR